MRSFFFQNIDLLIGGSILLIGAILPFLLGRYAGTRLEKRAGGAALGIVLPGLVIYAVVGVDRLLWTWLLPLPGTIVPGNSLLPGVALIGGYLSSARLTGIPESRRHIAALLLIVCAVVQSVRPFQGTVPRTQDVPRSIWAGDVCPQTSDATCSAASAATLLSTAGIATSESEMARLCLTRPEGTLMLGTYRGLYHKTEGTTFRVHALSNASIEELRRATIRNGPVLISVGIDYWQRGRIDPRYESLWGWTPGKRHAIVLFGFLPDGGLDIGDPAVGRERWKTDALSVLWRGDALQLIRR